MTERELRPPNLFGAGRVDPAVPGQPWWRDRREQLPEPARAPLAAYDANPPPDDPRRADQVRDDGELAPAEVEAAEVAAPAVQPEHTNAAVATLTHAQPVEVVIAQSRRPIPLVFAGLVLLAILYFAARAGTTSLGSFVVPLAGMSFAFAAAIWQTQRHPDEPWLSTWLIGAVVAKIVGAYLRYLTLVVGYEDRTQGGDAHHYHSVGREVVLFWQGKGPDPQISGWRETGFIMNFDGLVQSLVGYDFLAGFFVFALLAAAGSYMWYRAAADAVPVIDKKLFFLFVMFAPSIVFWPSAIGKEALMQLGIGAISLGLARLLKRRLFAGLLIGAGGGWLVWSVRPHLLAIAALAGGVAYVVGRVRSERGGILMMRPFGMAIIALLVAFTVSQGATFLELEDLSVSSIEQSLDETTESTQQGGSKFDPGSNSLSPLNIPQRVTTVLLRPFPWEVETAFQLIASLESALLIGLIVLRRKSIGASLRHCRSSPLLLYAWLFTIMYCAAYASFANFGLLVRQRSLVFPAILLILAVDPLLARRREEGEADLVARTVDADGGR